MVLDSLHLQGRQKGWSAAKGKDADHRSITCERAGQLHGPYADRPGLARTSNFWARPGPARWFSKIIEPGPNGPGCPAHAGL